MKSNEEKDRKEDRSRRPDVFFYKIHVPDFDLNASEPNDDGDISVDVRGPKETAGLSVATQIWSRHIFNNSRAIKPGDKIMITPKDVARLIRDHFCEEQPT